MIASRTDRLTAFALGTIVLLVAILTVTPWPVGAFQDDAIYTVLAKSLATGEGYRMLNLPGAPNATHYPPGYPLVLAALWKLSPEFPDNIVVFKFANTFFLAAAAVGTYWFARERWQLSVPAAAATALVGTLSIVVLLITGVVMSEPLFMALLLPALLLCERAAESGKVRTALLAGLLLGVLAMVRTLGAFAVPAAGLVLVLRGHWRAAVTLGVAAALFLVPWQWWVAAHEGEIVGPLLGKYGSYGGWLVDGYRDGGWALVRDVVLRNAQDIDNRISYMLLPVVPAWQRGIVFVALLVFLIAGTKRYARNTPVTFAFLALYMLVVMVWPFDPNRFLIATWPLWIPLVAFGFLACWNRFAAEQWRGNRLSFVWRGVVGGVALVMAGGYLWYNVTGYRRQWWVSIQRDAGVRAKPTTEWVARFTDPSDVLVTEDDLIVYLYTGRRAVPPATFTARERVQLPSAEEDLAVVRDLLERYDARFLVVGAVPGVRAARTLAGESPPVLQQVGSTPHVLIFRRLREP